MNLAQAIDDIRDAVHRIFAGNGAFREIAVLPGAERTALAHRLGVREQEFARLVSGREAAEKQLPRRLLATGLNVDDVSSKYGAVMRDMERVCSLCRFQNRCAKDLDSGACDRVGQYCANTTTIDALLGT